MKANYFKNLVILMSIVAIFAACKSNNEPETLRPPTKAQFDNLKNKALQDITQTKTFKAEEGIKFKSANGAELTIQPNCLLDDSNVPVTGNVELSFVEIYDKGNMVVTNKPVMALDAETGKTRPLITGGQFNIEIKQGSKKLKSECYHQLVVPSSLTGGTDLQMILWDGRIDSESGNLVYEEAEGREAGIKISNTSYDIFNNRFGWTNIDRFYNYDGPKTKIKVKVPAGYDSANAGLFVAIEGEKNLLAQLDYYDSAEKYFSEHYGFLPVGQKIHLIFVSENNGSVVYAIKNVTIVANQTITVALSDLQTGTLNQVVGLINALN